MDRNVGLGGVVLTEAVGGLDFQLPALLVQQHDGADGRVHGLRHHSHDELEHLFQKVVGGDGLADVREGLQLKSLPPGFLIEAGVFNGSADLVGDGHQQGLLAGGMAMGAAMLHVNDPDHLVLGNDRNREKGLIPIFRKVVEQFEAGIVAGVPLDGDRLSLLSHPAGNSLPQPHLDPADDPGVGVLGGSQHQLFPGLVQKVQETGISLRHMGYQIDDFVQDVFQIEISADRPADLVQDGDFLLLESQGGPQPAGAFGCKVPAASLHGIGHRDSRQLEGSGEWPNHSTAPRRYLPDRCGREPPSRSDREPRKPRRSAGIPVNQGTLLNYWS